MWIDKAPVYSDEQQAAQAEVETLRAQYDAVYEQWRATRRRMQEEINGAYESAVVRYQSKHTSGIQAAQDAVTRAKAVYDEAIRLYNTATETQQQVFRKQEQAMARVMVRARNQLATQYEAELTGQTTEIARLSEEVDKAQRAAQSLKYLLGIRMVSPDNNDGEAVIAPNGDVYMVPMYEDHSEVYERTASKYPTSERSDDNWIRISSSGGLSTPYKNSLDRDNVSDAQLNALSEMVDMLQTAGKQSGDTSYYRRAQRIYEWVNTAPAQEEIDPS